MSASLSDVAKRAGLSLATVSRVLSGSSYPVSAATRERVILAAEEFGYRPNAIARALVRRMTNTIGVIVGDITDPYFAEIARGVEDVGSAHGFLTIVCNADRNPSAELAYFEMLLEHQAAGVMFAGGAYPDVPETTLLKAAIARSASSSTKVLCLADRGFDDVKVVSVDNVAVLHDMTMHLIQLGHRRIAYVEGPEGLSTSIHRRHGFETAMKEAGLDCGLIFSSGFGIESGRVAATAMLARELPDAVIAATDETAIGVMVTLRQAGINIPRQVSVAGVDDTRYAQLTNLTTVRLPTYELGALAAQQILEAGQTTTDRTILLHRIVQRGSTTWSSASHMRASVERRGREHGTYQSEPERRGRRGRHLVAAVAVRDAPRGAGVVPGARGLGGTARPILDVEGLRTWFFTDSGIVRAVDGVDFDVLPGETVGIVGESGSGKSVTGLSIMRLIEEPGQVVAGRIEFRGRDVIGLGRSEMQHLRGRSIGMVFQDPMTSLNPVIRIGRQIVEGILIHNRGKVGRTQATDRAIGLLRRMGIPDPGRALQSYPHQFSGGMRQRVMLSIGFGNRPALVVADEPTTALDVTIQREILDLLRTLNTELGTSILLITHDLGVVAAICRRVVIMYAGEVVESGPAEDVLAQPLHPYTQSLLDAVPRLDRPPPANRRLTIIEGQPPDPKNHPAGCRFQPRCPYPVARCAEHPALSELRPGHRAACWVAAASRPPPWHGERKAAVAGAAAATARARRISAEPILEVEGLTKHFPIAGGRLLGARPVVHAVDDLSLTVRRGEALGLVGESGSGKSTVARLIIRLHEPTAGAIRFNGTDIARLDERALRPLRRHMQMIFQDPYASLNPRMTVRQTVAEPYAFHHPDASPAEVEKRVRSILDRVGLTAAGMADRYPHEFSGGQRQRIGIARSLILQPELVVADEPISALDVNIQAQIVNLLVDLQEELGLTLVIIAHDLAVVRHISDRIAVMYMGRIVELAGNMALFTAPLHPYTQLLMAAVPVPDVAVERARGRVGGFGEMPSVVDPPSGCRFRTRCPHARAICAEAVPPLTEHAPGHWAACHFAGALAAGSAIQNPR
ncbi:MAG: dipeptide ABC transporter ATP-binding protein [Geminicoccaceae bacterium]